MADPCPPPTVSRHLSRALRRRLHHPLSALNHLFLEVAHGCPMLALLFLRSIVIICFFSLLYLAHSVLPTTPWYIVHVNLAWSPLPLGSSTCLVSVDQSRLLVRSTRRKGPQTHADGLMGEAGQSREEPAA